MRRVPLLAPSAWVAATAVATVVSWLGVGAVTRAVTAAPEPVIPAATIARQHAHLNMALPIEQLVGGPTSSATRTTVPTEVREPTPTIVVPTTVVPAARPASTTTQPPPGSKTTTTSTTQGGTGEGNPPPPPPQPVSVTFTGAGGQVSVTDICTGTSIVVGPTFVSNGYQETTEIPGPGPLVEVSFSNGTRKHSVVIAAECSAGKPVKVPPPSGWGVNPNPDPDPGQF